MKKNIIKELKSQSGEQITGNVEKLRFELANLQLKNKINPVKDTNQMAKLRRQIAQSLTIINEKRLVNQK